MDTSTSSQPTAAVQPHRRRTVLLGWELGGGWGHLRVLVPLARELALRGYHPVLAVKNLVESWPLLQDVPFPVVQAPRWAPASGPGEANFVAASYADILAIRGFAAVDDLLPMVCAWQGLIDLIRPDLIVADHSPTLCLAAYGSTPIVVVGSGFTLPPCEPTQFPCLVRGVPSVVPPEQVLAVVQEVQRRRRRPAPETLPGLLAGVRVLKVLPELDPYRAIRQEKHLGPPGTDLGPLALPSNPRFLVYLPVPHAVTERVLTALVQARLPAVVSLRGASPAFRERWRCQGLEVLEAPRPIAELLAGTSAVLHNAGAALAQEALLTGRPQGLFPGHLEQSLHGSLLQRLGVGIAHAQQPAVETVASSCRQLLHEPRFAQTAAAVAADLQRRGPWNSSPILLERCCQMLA